MRSNPPYTLAELIDKYGTHAGDLRVKPREWWRILRSMDTATTGDPFWSTNDGWPILFGRTLIADPAAPLPCLRCGGSGEER